MKWLGVPSAGSPATKQPAIGLMNSRELTMAPPAPVHGPKPGESGTFARSRGGGRDGRLNSVMSVRDMPWWGIVSSAVPPVVLAAGWTIAAYLQTRPYDPLADSVSGLAGIGATGRWVMTLAFALSGACEIVTGLALRSARTAGRLILMAGGLAGILVAASPVHTGDGAPVSHIAWSAVGLAALAVWPAAASRHGRTVPWPLRPEISVWVAVILLLLLAWFGMELITSAGQAGLAERVLGEAQSGWPFVVAMFCRRPVTMQARYRPTPVGRELTERTGHATRRTRSAVGPPVGGPPQIRISAIRQLSLGRQDLRVCLGWQALRAGAAVPAHTRRAGPSRWQKSVRRTGAGDCAGRQRLRRAPR